MSTARLEIIKDDDNIPAHVSRSIPAVLDGLLTQAALDDFCDKLDVLFIWLHEEQERFLIRAALLIGALFYWIARALFFRPYKISMLIDPFMLTVIYIGIVLLCTQPGANAKSNKEILQLIRFECDEMSRRTPFASFHVDSGAMNHIDVSISLSAPTSGVIATSNTIIDTNISKIDVSSSNHQPVRHCAQTVTTTTATNDGYQQLNDVV
jgi:apolipoprotein N-acyltransferase